jgi:hypothetical protein
MIGIQIITVEIATIRRAVKLPYFPHNDRNILIVIARETDVVRGPKQAILKQSQNENL